MFPDLVEPEDAGLPQVAWAAGLFEGEGSISWSGTPRRDVRHTKTSSLGSVPKLEAYAQLVREWSSRLDLVAPGDLDRFEERHIGDSLRLLPLLKKVVDGPCIDVGSGVGLPGIPLAICSDRHWRLLEPRKKRAAFLEEAVRTLEIDAEVIVATAEDAARSLGAVHALATARALAPPERSFAIARPLVTGSGTVAVFVGSGPIPPGAEEWQLGIATMIVEASQGTL